MTEQEQRLILELGNNFPLTSRPFREIGKRVGMSEEAVIAKVKEYLEKGIIRRLSAALRQQHVGFTANAMVVWQVPPERVEEVGRKLASFPEVTHCYERLPTPEWPYNLYTMIHRPRREECWEIVRRLSEAVGIKDFLVLFSTQELKRSNPQYFTERGEGSE
ncbi:Lrp/AsnC family transcriptional regulator [Ammonifex thiophilus]|uniref:siroheme decarboxylase n=1 Tax=Ammonifex thiophilus TaxID=444093 RepID=A0A3D8P4V6_9THEO|nr:Lrp/AsnC family transcriptional regulator [Ammonifex thiophilus]RDV83013.1 Lrp/AsnC family transcriptional regulator [Ammonifex thiophilus]